MNMLPTTNSQVKLMFNNGISVEGKVITWSDDISVLQSSDGGKFIIHKTKDNVMVVKIIFESIDYSSKEERDNLKAKLAQKPKSLNDNDLKSGFIKTGEFELSSSIKDPPPPVLFTPETNQNLRHMKLAELRASQIKAKQQDLRDKMKTFSLSVPTEVKYNYPFQTKRTK